MKNEQIKQAVITLFEKAEEKNRQLRFKALHTFMSFRSHKLFEYGVYDYKSKRYVLHYAHSLTPESDIKELEAFITSRK